MHIALIAVYAGPDQVMTVTSGLASILGVLLIFWHKVVVTFHKVMDKFRRTPTTTTTAVPQKDTHAQS